MSGKVWLNIKRIRGCRNTIDKRYYKKLGGFSYLLGCKELTSTFCLSDDRVYGDMCGIAFERKGTIGCGDDKCDFYFHRD